MKLKEMTETFVLTYDHEQLLAENERLKKRVEELERLAPMAAKCQHQAEATGMYEPFDMACKKCGSFCTDETPNAEVTGRASAACEGPR